MAGLGSVLAVSKHTCAVLGQQHSGAAGRRAVALLAGA